MNRTFLIDSHVHIYPHYDVAAFFSTAHMRLSQAAAKTDARDATLTLMLTETAQDNAFTHLAEGTMAPEGWQVETFPEDPTALRVHNGARILLVVAGRQIVTKERIEILALGTRQTFTDGQGAEDVMTHLAAAETPAVIPWGLGKWQGKRGVFVRALLGTHAATAGVMLGDNAGRPNGWPKPKIFQTAATQNVPVLPGSDPLPIIGAEQDVGGFGFQINGDVDVMKPGISVTKLLYQMRGQPTVFGQRKNLPSVIMDQKKLRNNRQN